MITTISEMVVLLVDVAERERMKKESCIFNDDNDVILHDNHDGHEHDDDDEHDDDIYIYIYDNT